MSERTPIVVNLVTDDIHGDVEFELALEEGTLTARAENARIQILSLYWFVDGPRIAREINALLEAITPHAQVMVDAYHAIAGITEEAI